MSADPSTLHMVRLALRADGLFLLARRRGLPPRTADLGYLAHAVLRELFGDDAPCPFAVESEQGRWLPVLGYARAPAPQLQQSAQQLADPGIWELCDWATLASKPMPPSWPPGARLGFRVRVCPIRRMASAGPKHRKGAEVDEFLARCWKLDDPSQPVDREVTYREWLANRLAQHGAASLESATLERFCRQRLLRRTQGSQRRSIACERPDALLRGTLRVDDPSAFQRLLEHGVGRHRSFGFGMLLLSRG